MKSYLNKSTYNSKALAAYSWMRTDRGPQNSWAHKIGKAASQTCPTCDHPVANGQHITFHCPTWSEQRKALIGERTSWEALDEPIWIKTGPEKKDTFDGGEAWFSHIFGFLAI